MGINLDTATFAGGCFWCTEAVFKRLKGIKSVTPGFSGGELESPTYEQVVGGKTGHVEAVQIVFDPEVISYDRLLDVFWATHNPTTLNRQGNDVGPQYRSAIFYHSPEQKEKAEQSKRHLDQSKAYSDPIVTEITEYSSFYPAGPEHKDFYDRNRQYGYCRVIIDPKIQKLMKEFSEDLGEEGKW
jgi:peptide-methionine (S)-S-oxide reductase